MTALTAHYEIHLFEKQGRVLAVSPYKKITFPDNLTDLADTSMNHKTQNDFYQDNFECLRTKSGDKLISMTMRDKSLQ